jgi:hypothetical protein
MRITQVPGRMYDYVYQQYGWWGFLFGGIIIACMIMLIWTYMDRRR